MKSVTHRYGSARRGLFGAAALLLFGALHAQTVDQTILNSDQLAHASGEQIFQHICQGCHMPDARGATGAGNYPALAKDPNLASAPFMAAVVLNGRRDMPSFMVRNDLHGFEAMVRVGLDDAQIAAVVNYVRSHFGNHYTDKLSAADVAALHAPKKESP
ncbi:MAG: c-type cytochrome [Rudaea sp.]